MFQVLDTLLIIALGLNFLALVMSRIHGVISVVAAQGMLLGTLPLFVHPELWRSSMPLVAVTIALKGFILPLFLRRAALAAHLSHEIKPIVSYMISLLLGAAGTGLALEFSSRLPLAPQHSNTLLVPASFATVWTGVLLLTTRREALMQVLGYLLLENGTFLFSLLLLEAMPFLVEIGVLLDLFTGVFVMGIIIHHINRQFASINTEYLTELKE
jgi:hydrogenase-4 component E